MADETSKEEFDKQDNERCFLPNKENINYDSIIIFEIFSIEEFNELFNGLDKLYANKHHFDTTRLNYRQILRDGERTSFRGTMYLPPILNTKIKDEYMFVAFQDLGDTVDSITITLHANLPSIISLQIQSSLNSSISDKINGIIYSYHDTVQEKTVTPRGKITTYYDPRHLKNKEINEIRNKLKNQIIELLSTYFEGFFFKYANKHISYIPSIDLFSLSYPAEKTGIEKWLSSNRDFLSCFNVLALPRTVYKYENCVILASSQKTDIFSNYLILANLNTTRDDIGYSSKKNAIQDLINRYSFELLSLNRWLDIEQKIGTNYSLSISKELEYITKNKLQEVISNREKFSRYLFSFERFKLEFNEFTFMLIDNESKFELLENSEKSLFDNFIKIIKQKISYMDGFINTLNRHSDNTLAVKNIEYTMDMQNDLFLLTIFVAILTCIQIFLSLPEMSIVNLILKIATNYITNNILDNCSFIT